MLLLVMMVILVFTKRTDCVTSIVALGVGVKRIWLQCLTTLKCVVWVFWFFLALKNAFGYLLYLRTQIKKHKNPPLCTSSLLTRLTTILNGFLSYPKKYCAKELANSLVRWELFSDLMTFREHLGFLYFIF